MLSYIKAYRKLRGGKWYKVMYNGNLIQIIYYTKTKPFKSNHWIIKKYRY